MNSKYKMLAVDLDGTLLTAAKEIRDEDLAAIRRAMEEGRRICISTGRAWPGSLKFVGQIKPNAPVSNSNGSQVSDPETGRILFKEVLQADTAVDICREGIAAGATLIIWCGNRFYSNRLDDMAWDYSHRFAGVEPLLAGMDEKAAGAEDPGSLSQRTPGAEDGEKGQAVSIRELANLGISKILWHGSPDKVRIWLERARACNFANVSVCTSEPDILELFSSSVSKARALDFIGSMYGIKPEEMIAVGDGANDIEMLRHVGLGVAMANAGPEVRKAAALVTEHDNEHGGVAEVICRYLLGEQAELS